MHILQYIVRRLSLFVSFVLDRKNEVGLNEGFRLYGFSARSLPWISILPWGTVYFAVQVGCEFESVDDIQFWGVSGIETELGYWRAQLFKAWLS